ncbi:C_GCAxxG_C_C family probable redox protein [Bacilli bacterium PM5-3]|nr:C_GCAxxG_C_C family probable redox protein [Bacilli bacterium PM5-3]MDH6604037.1 C_GCAxxG_C_C family probable redox protein [Bacilli bacterium PM5-9]
MGKQAVINKTCDYMIVDGYNCAQSIIYGMSLIYDEIDIKKRDEYIDIAKTFGGGVAGLQQTCGFIIGSNLGYSLIYTDAQVIKDKVNKINDLIIDVAGSWQCEKIIENFNDIEENRRLNCSKILAKIISFIYDDSNKD